VCVCVCVCEYTCVCVCVCEQSKQSCGLHFLGLFSLRTYTLHGLSLLLMGRERKTAGPPVFAVAHGTLDLLHPRVRPPEALPQASSGVGQHEDGGAHEESGGPVCKARSRGGGGLKRDQGEGGWPRLRAQLRGQFILVGWEGGKGAEEEEGKVKACHFEPSRLNRLSPQRPHSPSAQASLMKSLHDEVGRAGRSEQECGAGEHSNCFDASKLSRIRLSLSCHTDSSCARQWPHLGQEGARGSGDGAHQGRCGLTTGRGAHFGAVSVCVQLD
jgi:hypothetical protein